MLGEEQEENNFNCCKTVLAKYQQEWNPSKSLSGDLALSSPETVKHMTVTHLSPMSGYIQTSLTAVGWAGPAIDSVLLMLSAGFIVKGPVTQRPWCQPRSVSARDLVPAPKFCHHWTKQSLLVASWPVLLWLLWNPYSWKHFFHWHCGVLLCFSLPGMLKHFCFFFNKIENSYAWGGVGGGERICFNLTFSFQLTFGKLFAGQRLYNCNSSSGSFVVTHRTKRWQQGGAVAFFSSIAFLLFNLHFSGVTKLSFWSFGDLPKVHMEIFASGIKLKKKPAVHFQRVVGEF